MRVLALDLATRTGWALQTPGAFESGVQDFSLRRGESVGMMWIHFRKWLERLALVEVDDGLGHRNGVDLIVYEQPFVMRSGRAAEVSIGLATRVQEFATIHGIEHATANGSTVKKWITGKGNAKKPEVIAAVCRHGFHLGTRHNPCAALSDNEADAIAILKWAERELVPAEVRR